MRQIKSYGQFKRENVQFLDSGLDHDSRETLQDDFTVPAYTTLDFSDITLLSSGIYYICSSLANNNIAKTLVIHEYGFGTIAFDSIAHMLQTNTCLENLYIIDIDDSMETSTQDLETGLIKIANALETNSSLKTLAFRFNNELKNPSIVEAFRNAITSELSNINFFNLAYSIYDDNGAYWDCLRDSAIDETLRVRSALLSSVSTTAMSEEDYDAPAISGEACVPSHQNGRDVSK